MSDLERALQRARNEMLAERFGRIERHWERTDQAIHQVDIDETRDHGRFQVARTEQARTGEYPYGYEPLSEAT